VAAETEVHETSTSMVNGVLAKIGAGTDLALKVRVSCRSACDLRGSIVRIVAQDGCVAREIELNEFDGTGSETDQFVVKAPLKLGAYEWAAVFLAQEREGVLHEQSSVPFSFIVKRHATSIAVWDVPSPVLLDARFAVKVGVKCHAECKLTGNKYEIYDQQGAELATGTLGDVPWPGTASLYWADIELRAPRKEGYYVWRVRFPKPGLGVPHEEASDNFGFTTARSPEHVVTVEVTDKLTKAPIRNAEVVLQPRGGSAYRHRTDECGVAKVGVPEGEYQLWVSKDTVEDAKGEYDPVLAKLRYVTLETTVEVDSDVTIKAELSAVPRMG